MAKLERISKTDIERKGREETFVGRFNGDVKFAFARE